MISYTKQYLKGTAAGIGIIVIFILCAVKCSFAQKVTRDEYLSTKGKPTWVANTINAYAVDHELKQVWKSMSKTAANWVLEADTNIINHYLGRKGDKGDKGDPGPQGPPGVNTSGPIAGIIFVTPSNSANTFRQSGWTQASIDQVFPGAGGTLDDAVDKIMLTYCTLKAKQTGQPLWMWSVYFVNGSWIRPNLIDLKIYGNMAKVRSTTAGNYSLFRPASAPVTSQEAENAWVGTKLSIQDLTFEAMFPGQIGMETGPTCSSFLTNVNGHGGAIGIKAMFCLNFNMTSCEFKNNADIGLSVTHHPVTNYNGANTNGNAAVFIKLRCVSPNSGGNTGMFFKDIGNLTIINPTLEGTGYNKGIHIDGIGSNTTKLVRITEIWDELHINHTNILTQSLIYIRMMGGNIMIDGGIQIGNETQGRKTFLNVGSYVGLMSVEVKHIADFTPFGGNKWFYNAGGVGVDASGNRTGSIHYTINKCQTMGPTFLPGIFAGDAVSEGASGANKCTFIPI